MKPVAWCASNIYFQQKPAHNQVLLNLASKMTQYTSNPTSQEYTFDPRRSNLTLERFSTAIPTIISCLPCASQQQPLKLRIAPQHS
jgi:hypothetical protein